MAKIKQPTTTTTTTTPAPSIEATAPIIDYGALAMLIAEKQTNVLEFQGRADSGNIDCALDAIEFRQANPEAERKDIVLAIAQGIAEPRGLKVDDIIKAPDKTLNAPTATPAQREKYTTRNSAYTLLSSLATIAWPKDADAEKRVKKLLDSGERGFVKLKAAASKKQKNPAAPTPTEDKITEDNFGTRLGLFLTKALMDLTPTDADEIEAMTHVATEAWKVTTKAV